MHAAKRMKFTTSSNLDYPEVNYDDIDLGDLECVDICRSSMPKPGRHQKTISI